MIYPLIVQLQMGICVIKKVKRGNSIMLTTFRGVVHKGRIHLADVSLPEGAQVLVTVIPFTDEHGRTRPHGQGRLGACNCDKRYGRLGA